VLPGVLLALLSARGLAQPAPAAPAAAAPAADTTAAPAPAKKPAAKPAASASGDAGGAAATGASASAGGAAAGSGAAAAPAKRATAGTGGRAAGGRGNKPAAAGGTAPAAEPAAAKLTAAPKSAVLTKAELYQRAAPATVMLIAHHDTRFNTALGVIVKPHGVVISDSRLLSGVEAGKVSAFLYDPSLAGDEDPLVFLRAHKDEALPVQVVRVDTAHHLLMLQLPAPAPKKPYPALELYDTHGIATVGLDVVALRTRGRQTLAMLSGSIAAMRPDQFELSPDLNTDADGAPVLSPTGRLLGVVTFSDKNIDSAGVVRPVDVLHELLLGKVGAAPKETTGPSLTEVSLDSRNGVEALRIALGSALASRMDKKAAMQLQSEFIASMALHGRLPIAVESGEWMNKLVEELTDNYPPREVAANELFPLLVVDKNNKTWRRIFVRDPPKYDVVRPKSKIAYLTCDPSKGHCSPHYELMRQSGGGVAAIDDTTGALYTTDPQKQLMWYDEEGKSWRNTGISPVAQAKATGGMLFLLLTDGRLMSAKRDGHDAMQLYPRSLNGASIEASNGTLYLVENGSVYRYHEQAWERKLKPIAFAMHQIASHGEDWYGLDQTGRVFSSVAQRYIDRDGNIAAIWPIGKDLLVLTRDGQRYFYSVANDTWMTWTQW
jgi:hypothetical protein